MIGIGTLIGIILAGGIGTLFGIMAWNMWNWGQAITAGIQQAAPGLGAMVNAVGMLIGLMPVFLLMMFMMMFMNMFIGVFRF